MLNRVIRCKGRSRSADIAALPDCNGNTLEDKHVPYFGCLPAVPVVCAPPVAFASPLVVASDPTFPPNEMLNKDKEIVGFSIDYIKAVGKEAGFDVQVKNIAWDGIFAALASNQVDVIAASVSITDKRKKAMLFTDPYYELHQAVVLPLGKEIKDLEELAGKRVGGQIGTTAMVQTIPASKIKMIVKTYDEVGLAFEDLAKGNLDARDV